jgi:hypothetical protein
MTYREDYGMRLLRDGLSVDLDHFFYDFRLYSLSILGLGRFSTSVEMPYGGELLALSLDFNQGQLEQILSKGSPELRTFIEGELALDSMTPRSIDFDGFISFGVRARFGDVQQVERESFVPLVAQEIF